jgi:uncharacterized protein (TIGR03435 family)
MRPRLHPQRTFYCLPLLLLLTGVAIAQPAHPAFEVASVKPADPAADPNTGSYNYPGHGSFIANHLSLAYLIHLAWDIDIAQIANQPAWLNTNLYDISAKPEDGIALTREELRPRLQNLLQQRFHLIAHMETRSGRGYALVVADGGPHLTPSQSDRFAGSGIANDTSFGHMRGASWTMDQFAKYLTHAAGFPVINQTGISGSYQISFLYNPKPDDTDSTLPTLDVALKQSTGLLLKPQKIPVETLVIDSVNKLPTAN